MYHVWPTPSSAFNAHMQCKKQYETLWGLSLLSPTQALFVVSQRQEHSEVLTELKTISLVHFPNSWREICDNVQRRENCRFSAKHLR
jgi:hypothetical protein